MDDLTPAAKRAGFLAGIVDPAHTAVLTMELQEGVVGVGACVFWEGKSQPPWPVPSGSLWRTGEEPPRRKQDAEREPEEHVLGEERAVADLRSHL